LSRAFEAYVESGRKILEQLGNHTEIAKKVSRIVREAWPDAKVYLFGSVLEGKYTAMSDIDLLIVVDGVDREEAYRVQAMIYGKIEGPLELHVASAAQFDRWYRRLTNHFEEII